MASKLPIVCLCFLFFSCKKPYNPPVTAANPGYLVVEGVINSGSDSSIISLSHTVQLSSDSTKINSPETGSRVLVESSKNDVYSLYETVPGTYVTANLNLPTDRTYRLHIFTSLNKEYVSDYVQNLITPPIDSVYSVPLTEGVQFYVSTHNPANTTNYYRWDYNQRWTYLISPYESSAWVYQNGQIIPRTMSNLIKNTCYIYPLPSSSIFIASSHLAQGAINKAPLGYVDTLNGKLVGEFSLLVKQYALTASAYSFWNLLKTNTEQLGTLFDAQPSSAVSNIHEVTNLQRPVVGYFSVSTVTNKRIFLSGRTLPFAVVRNPPILPVQCPSKYISVQPDSTFQYRLQQTFGSGDSIITNAVTVYHSTTILGYNYAALNCLDCNTSGGTNATPPYWPFP